MEPSDAHRSARSPIHVVYGGADRFSAETPAKFGRIALETLREYAPNFVDLARALELRGSADLPHWPGAVAELAEAIRSEPDRAKLQHPGASLAWNIYEKTIRKLETEPIEDYRIDFEDGYGFRENDEEDGHAVSASIALATAFDEGIITDFSGIRIKALSPETGIRANRTLKLFLDNLLDHTSARLPENFVVTLPKVTCRTQVEELCKSLDEIEQRRGLEAGAIGVELMIETPEALIDPDGKIGVRGLVHAADGRCTSVHFGAYDYTAALGISASYQDIRHPACNFARQMMQAALAGTRVRLVDSVTTVMPVPVHRGEGLTEHQRAKNVQMVYGGWLRHFRNVTASMGDGFYQSWDLHPNQLVARYAAVYAFFLDEMDSQANRLRGYIERATKATLTGNTFDDAASVAGLITFFERGIACGAFSEDEVAESTGTGIEDISRQFKTV